MMYIYLVSLYSIAVIPMGYLNRIIKDNILIDNFIKFMLEE